MQKWQIEMINKITIGNPNYDKELALDLANEWNQAHEKWMMITDTFCLSNDHPRIDSIVDSIEYKLEKVLESNKESLDQNADCWMWMCGE